MTASPRFAPLMTVSKRPDIVMVEGRGSWLTDETGKRYLDFVQGWAVNSLGHSPDVIVDAIVAQSRRLINASPSFYTQPLLDLATLITSQGRLDRVFFTNCGAEANEGAIKLARKWGAKHRERAYEIITMRSAFHGRTLATMSASDKPGWDSLFEPKVPGFIKIPVNDIAAVERHIGNRTVGVMLEPIQGEAGVHLASDEFMQQLRQLTADRGILLICDEVQTGMGRTGALFAHQHARIEPDIMTLGKGIAGGAPLGALVARESVCCFDVGDQGGTFNGNALITAVGAAVFRAINTPTFLENVTATGEYLKGRLEIVRARHDGREVRGRGLLVALVLAADKAPEIAARALEAGLLINAARPNVLRFMPALNVSRAEVDAMIEMLEPLL